MQPKQQLELPVVSVSRGRRLDPWVRENMICKLIGLIVVEVTVELEIPTGKFLPFCTISSQRIARDEKMQ